MVIKSFGNRSSSPLAFCDFFFGRSLLLLAAAIPGQSAKVFARGDMVRGSDQEAAPGFLDPPGAG
jgi:hypothetical protein